MATKEKAMTTVMKLLALAADENAPASERELAAQRAENLMAQHMIDRMDLKPEEKSKAIKDSWTLNLGDTDWEFRDAIRQLVVSILRHNNIRFYPKLDFGKNEFGHTDYDVEVWTIVGLPEDIAYAEAIWFRVFREFVMNVSPKWDAGKSLGYNAYNFTRAGHKWRAVWYMAYEHGHKIAAPGTVDYIPSTLKREVRKYMDENGLGEYEAHTQSHKKYRTSFAQSFAGTISRRLQQMRAEAGKVTDKDRFALAIRSTAEYIDEEFDKMFPEVKDMLAAMAREQLRDRGRNRNMKVDRTFNEAAWKRGAEAANNVDLKISTEVKRKKAGELK
jgi:hypothetical protein